MHSLTKVAVMEVVKFYSYNGGFIITIFECFISIILKRGKNEN